MTPYLLDTNVLIALAWPNHVHHREAQVTRAYLLALVVAHGGVLASLDRAIAMLGRRTPGVVEIIGEYHSLSS